MPQMEIFIIRILVCALLGVGVGFAGVYFAKLLLKQRGLEYSLTKKAERLIICLMGLPGGAIGGFCGGYFLPVCGLCLLCICLTVSLTDFTNRIIPNQGVLALLLLSLAFGIPSMCGVKGFPEFDIVQSLIGLAVCFAVFALPGLFGKKVGAGEIKLAAAMGFCLGINYALLAIALMGILVILYAMAQRRLPLMGFLKTQIPMAPFITVGCMASFVLSGAQLIL